MSPLLVTINVDRLRENCAKATRALAEAQARMRDATIRNNLLHDALMRAYDVSRDAAERAAAEKLAYQRDVWCPAYDAVNDALVDVEAADARLETVLRIAAEQSA